MPSFDIVCEVDLQEIDNVINQVEKEVANRFDFRGSKSKVELDKTNQQIKIEADDDMKLRALHQIIDTKMAKRNLDIRSLSYEDTQEASGGIIRQVAKLKNGLSKDEAKKITKYIKELKIKVQPQIRDDLLRVTGKKIDDLQQVISSLKENDMGLPLQYINMRS